MMSLTQIIMYECGESYKRVHIRMCEGNDTRDRNTACMHMREYILFIQYYVFRSLGSMCYLLSDHCCRFHFVDDRTTKKCSSILIGLHTHTNSTFAGVNNPIIISSSSGRPQTQSIYRSPLWEYTYTYMTQWEEKRKIFLWRENSS